MGRIQGFCANFLGEKLRNTTYTADSLYLEWDVFCVEFMQISVRQACGFQHRNPLWELHLTQHCPIFNKTPNVPAGNRTGFGQLRMCLLEATSYLTGRIAQHAVPFFPTKQWTLQRNPTDTTISQWGPLSAASRSLWLPFRTEAITVVSTELTLQYDHQKFLQFYTI